MEGQQADSDAASPGMMAGLGGLAKNMFGLLVSRIELAALELGEVRDNLAKLLLMGAFAMVVLLCAVGCWTALIIVLAWESMGWKVLLLAAVLHTLLAIGILLYARAMLRQNRLAMPATLAELRNDRDALM